MPTYAPIVDDVAGAEVPQANTQTALVGTAAPLPAPVAADPSRTVAIATPDTPPPASPAGVGQPRGQHIRDAYKTAEAFLRYLGGVEDHASLPPPIWNSPVVLSSAEQFRRELRSSGLPAFSGERLRLGSDFAVLTSDFAVAGNSAERGLVTVDLVWREERWLVTGFSMERTP